MITRREVEQVIQAVEQQVGPLKTFDSQHVAIRRQDLRVLLLAAKDCKYSYGLDHSVRARQGAGLDE